MGEESVDVFWPTGGQPEDGNGLGTDEEGGSVGGRGGGGWWDIEVAM